MVFDGLPIHDFENDSSISERRKEACKMAYIDMQPSDIDKIYTSTYVYDKKTGEPVAKKPRSLHELVYLLMQSIKQIEEENHSLNNLVSYFEKRLSALENDAWRKSGFKPFRNEESYEG